MSGTPPQAASPGSVGSAGTPATPPRVGVLAMAYGTPSGPEQIEPYYTHVRHGHPPSDAQLAELRGRYAAIGGRSPLLEITAQQVIALRAALRARAGEVAVTFAFKHCAPFLEDGVAELLTVGVERIVAVVLAPHYSTLSVGEYANRVQAAAAGKARVSVVRSWHLEPSYLELLRRLVSDALLRLPSAARAHARVYFTAHSLPQRILAAGDPYPDQLNETAAAVAKLAGLERWGVAWQSAGRTPEAWIGPDVLEVLAQEAKRPDQTSAVVICPCGFVADHLEVLYDLDIEAAQRAAQLGIPFARTASPNAAPELIEALAGAVTRQIERDA